MPARSLNGYMSYLATSPIRSDIYARKSSVLRSAQSASTGNVFTNIPTLPDRSICPLPSVIILKRTFSDPQYLDKVYAKTEAKKRLYVIRCCLRKLSRLSLSILISSIYSYEFPAPPMLGSSCITSSLSASMRSKNAPASSMPSAFFISSNAA